VDALSWKFSEQSVFRASDVVDIRRPYEKLLDGTAIALSAFLAPENTSKKEHPHRDLSTSLRSGRDDKGEGGASMGK
jgi:hypothetical protein